MWNWADDYGVGSANHRQLLGFAFPNDEDISVKDLPSLCKEVADSYGIVFFDYKERPYYVIPSWNEHQRTERRARRDEELAAAAEHAVLAHKHAEVEGVAEMRGSSDATQGGSVAGTGEREQGKGNRGTGEPAIPSPDLDALFEDAYSRWPKKVERKQASERFKRICSRRDPFELVADIQRFGDAYVDAGVDPQYVPGLGVWLNGERWTDDLPQRPRNQAQQAQLSRADEAHDFIQRLGAIDAVSGGGEAVGDYPQLRQ